MEDLAVLDGALPLVIGDSWDWQVMIWADPERRTPYDLTDKAVMADIRWPGGDLPVTVTVTDAAAGQLTLSLEPVDTMPIPRGRISTLWLDIEDGAERTTWLRAPVEGKEGSVVWLPSP